MPSVCFFFEVHQPYRVRAYDIFQVGVSHDYFDEKLNRELIRKIATKCYLPANEAMLELIERHDGRFRVSYSLSGVVLEQLQSYAPEVIESFQKLAKTGAVEFLAETYYHSLASLHDEAEFRDQVGLHTRLMKSLFGVTPRVFRNTELVYDDRIGRLAGELGFKGILAEGVDDVLDWRSPNYVYQVEGRNTALLLKNYKLSDDIAFRFSNRAWPDYPLTAQKFARWVHEQGGDVVNLFMDYETFGEHQWKETGIFDFLNELPDAILEDQSWEFATPSEVIDHNRPVAPLHFHRTTSWADVERDVSAWNGNDMQKRALEAIYGLGERIKRRNNPALLALWRKLTTSDHFYYMSTKWFADGDVHAYFSPYESPYEAFIHYMNVVSDLEENVMRATRTPVRSEPKPVVLSVAS